MAVEQIDRTPSSLGPELSTTAGSEPTSGPALRSSGTDLRASLQQFLTHLADYRDCSPRTVKAYEQDALLFIRFLEEAGVAVVEQVLPQHVHRYAARLTHLAPASIRRRAHALRGWFRHLVDVGIIARNPVAALELPKRRAVLPKVPSREQCDALLYARRGEAENRIKELKNDLQIDRTSCHRFAANQLRVVLHAAAFVLVTSLRPLLAGTAWAQAQVCTLRRDLLYRAGTWERPRRVVAKIEWHAGELFPRVGFIVTNRTDPAPGVVRFYNGRGTCQQWIKEGKHALEWMRLSCHHFQDNAVRLALFVLAYNLGNFLRRRALPPEMARWSMTTLREKLVKIGARLTRHARRLILQMAEVAVTRELFAQILSRIRLLSPVPT